MNESERAFLLLAVGVAAFIVGAHLGARRALRTAAAATTGTGAATPAAPMDATEWLINHSSAWGGIRV